VTDAKKQFLAAVSIQTTDRWGTVPRTADVAAGLLRLEAEAGAFALVRVPWPAVAVSGLL